MGLFSSDSVKPRAGNLFDTLCAQLETLMAYEADERDLLMMQEKFVVEWKDGTEVCPIQLASPFSPARMCSNW